MPVDHVSGEDHNGRKAQAPVDFLRVDLPMLQNQVRITPGGMQISVTAGPGLGGAFVPFLRFRPALQDQRRLAQRGEGPVIILPILEHGLLALIPNPARELARRVLVSHEQVDGGGVNTRPTAARAGEGLRINVGRLLQIFVANFRSQCARGQVLVGPSQHSECFFVGLTFPAQLFQESVGSLRRAAARQRQSLQLTQTHIGRPHVQSFPDDVVGKQRLALAQDRFA